MARASTAVALVVFAVCYLLVDSAPALRPVDLTLQLPNGVDLEAAAEKLLPKPMQVAYQADAAIAVPHQEEDTAITVPVEDGRLQKRSSLLCLVFRCGAEPAAAGGAAVASGSTLDRQVPAGTAEGEEVRGEQRGAYDSDSDCDSDSDFDDEDEGGIMGWFWRLVDGF